VAAVGTSELGCQFWVPKYCVLKDVERCEMFIAFRGSVIGTNVVTLRNVSGLRFVLVLLLLFSSSMMMMMMMMMMMTDKHLKLGVRNLLWRQNLGANINSDLNIFLTRRVSANCNV